MDWRSMWSLDGPPSPTQVFAPPNQERGQGPGQREDSEAEESNEEAEWGRRQKMDGDKTAEESSKEETEEQRKKNSMMYRKRIGRKTRSLRGKAYGLT